MDVKYYQTNQNLNFDKDFYNKDKLFFTLSFVYIVQCENESLFFAYD